MLDIGNDRLVAFLLVGEQGHLYFHSPCFDGIASAVLAGDFLEATRGMGPLALRPVNYDLRAAWLSSELKTPCAVVDFLYHPRADFWADHHATAFLSDEAHRDYERRCGPSFVYDDTAGSCAGLLWRHLAKAFGHQTARFAELVEWAEKIDAARYSSVEEALASPAPALRLAAGLALGDPGGYCEGLVRALRTEPLEAVSELPEARDRFRRVDVLTRTGLERFAKALRLEADGIAVFDVERVPDALFSRYAPYYYFPDARYSAGVVRSSGDAKITTMRNPWREFPSVPLGKICEGFGGGGHHRVGSILLRGERVGEASIVLAGVLAEIRKKQAELDRGKAAT